MKYHPRQPVRRRPALRPSLCRSICVARCRRTRNRVIHLAGREALRRNRPGGMDPNLRIRLCAGLPESDPLALTKALSAITAGIALAERQLAALRQWPPVPARPALTVPRRASKPVPVPSTAAPVPPPPRGPDPLPRWTFRDHVAAALNAGPPDLDELHADALRMGAPSRADAADWLERAIDSHTRHQGKGGTR